MTEKEDSKGKLIEDIGEEYLEELIDRCMVQVDKNINTEKGVKSCRLHDLMRDFCLSKAKEEDFLEIIQPNEVNAVLPSSSSAQHLRSRRIALHFNKGLDWRSSELVKQVHPRLHSLLCFSVHILPSFSTFVKDFELLRVLQLEFLGCPKLPSRIGYLIHLRYLKVKGQGNSFHLPHSIGNLQNLQTLDLIGIEGYFKVLPNTVWKLKQLRHLLLPLYNSPSWLGSKHIFKGPSELKLVTLKGINANDLIKHNSTLPMSNIKVLGINNLRSNKEVNLILESLSSQSTLGSLQSLTMLLLEPTSFPKVELLSQCQDLTKLKLHGTLPIETLSFLPKSLTKLILQSSQLNQSKIMILETLSSLRILQLGFELLNEHQKCQHWVFSVHGFPKLEILDLLYIENIEEWDIEQGALLTLKRLDITGLSKLKMLPNGLKYVTTLRELNVKRMRREFEDRTRVVNGTEGPDFFKVRHVPVITYAYTKVD